MNNSNQINYFMRPVLYKIHDDENCEDLLNLRRYLHYKGVDIRPINIIERDFPSHINGVLPTIVFFNGLTLYGLANILTYYENVLKVTNLYEDSNKFIQDNPNYRITDNSTYKHQKIKFIY